MAEFSADAVAYAALMLAGKTLEKLQEKGALSEAEAISAVQNAVNTLARNPELQEARKVLLHLYPHYGS